MLKKFNEFVEESVFRSTVMHSTGKVVKNEDDPTPMIIAFMDRHKITDYTINDDFTVDVEKSDINIKKVDLIDGKLPFQFGIVGGDFVYYKVYLTSLKGCCPIEVGGSFRCSHNDIKSLEGCPNKVCGDFVCGANQLSSLEGCPTEVGHNFLCDLNNLTSLEGCPILVGGNFICSNNQLTSLEGCPKEVGGIFGCSNNKIKFTKEEVRSFCDVKGGVLC